MPSAAMLFSTAVICALGGGWVHDGHPPIEGDWLSGALLALIPRITGHRRGHPPLRVQEPPGWLKVLALAALVGVAAVGVGLATVLQ